LAQIGQLAEHDVVIMRSIGAMALVIAAVFVGSMLQRSVAERRTEIATLRAIGVPNRAIAGLVLAEAVLVTLAALPLGLALAVLGGGWVNATYAAWLDVDDVYKPASGTVAAVLGLGVASGLLASALPLRGALRVQPADALREA
jgi:putative ABC transport system permease protein